MQWGLSTSRRLCEPQLSSLVKESSLSSWIIHNRQVRSNYGGTGNSALKAYGEGKRCLASSSGGNGDGCGLCGPQRYGSCRN